MSSPSYFFALFGDPNPPEKDMVESGLYHPHPDTAPFPTKPGDVLLLYCAASYQEHALQIPGIGVTLKSDEKVISYRYLPFAEAIPKYKIDQGFAPDDAGKFKNIRFNRFWLFKISKDSFVRVVGEQRILWP